MENCQTSHQAITNFKGNWYFLYHNGILAGGNNFRRSVCIEPFSFRADGTIPLLSPTKSGVTKALAHVDPFKRVEAETIAWSEGLEAATHPVTGVYITGIHNGDYIRVRAVDFKKRANTFLASVMPVASNGVIEVRRDSLSGALLTSCRIEKQKEGDEWITVSSAMKKIKGVHDVYLVFKGTDEGKLFDFDWWYCR